MILHRQYFQRSYAYFDNADLLSIDLARMCETCSVCGDQSHGLFTLHVTGLGVEQKMKLVQ